MADFLRSGSGGGGGGVSFSGRTLKELKCVHILLPIFLTYISVSEEGEKKVIRRGDESNLRKNDEMCCCCNITSLLIFEMDSQRETIHSTFRET
ncbi:hypothetical protein Phum_PHUM483810 [Pediculus humanus corporis]|uniref:Uncharacterized protein n=1 Tax=Pediculus humanus subsp. corporis TaxID=121224 RepID=E0VWH5_PEDHC|nr:uncharacterized protein Phum_PHUM483810 [Pediculus humanus corporis]EEB17731.1 hypothetical protein Phum_PHUM483810 [Pediculus humanus corporis]